MSLPTVPKTSPILLDTYNTLNSLTLPPPSTFPYPLIESFAAAHDPLTEEHRQKILTASMALKEAGVQVERAIRDLSKVDGDGKAEDACPSPMLSLLEVKRSRLRAKLQSVTSTIPPLWHMIVIYYYDLYSNLNHKLPHRFLHLKNHYSVPPRSAGQGLMARWRGMRKRRWRGLRED